MAGLGRKVFTAGEVLRAADVNGYLMDQTVQVYAGTAARGSAIGTATTEGMITYLADTNKLQAATGTATWVDVSSKIVQVVQGTLTTTASSSSTSFTDTGLSVTITPTVNTSTILLICQGNASITYPSSFNSTAQFRLTGGNSSNFVGDAASNRTRTAIHLRSASAWIPADTSVPFNITYMDSPATTSATTYKLQYKYGESGAGGGVVYINRSYNDTDSTLFGRTASSLIAIEVLA